MLPSGRLALRLACTVAPFTRVGPFSQQLLPGLADLLNKDRAAAFPDGQLRGLAAARGPLTFQQKKERALSQQQGNNENAVQTPAALQQPDLVKPSETQASAQQVSSWVPLLSSFVSQLKYELARWLAALLHAACPCSQPQGPACDTSY